MGKKVGRGKVEREKWRRKSGVGKVEGGKVERGLWERWGRVGKGCW